MMSLKSKFGFLRSMAIYYGKPFNRRKLKSFYGQFIKKDTLCFDIGAHLGNRVDAWLALDAKVVAVDPQPMCFDFLKKHFGQNNNVQLVSKAIGSERGSGVMHISSLAPTVSTLADFDWRNKIKEKSSFDVKWDKEIEIEIVTLDDLIGKYGCPEFCKIDVEDFEVEALKGLSYPIKALSFEYFSYMPDRIEEAILELNRIGKYEFNWSHGESLKFESSSWLDSDSMQKWVKQLTGDEASGDVYARLIF